MMTDKNKQDDTESNGTKNIKKKLLHGKCHRCGKNGHPYFKCKSKCYCRECKSDSHAQGTRFCKQGGNQKQSQRKGWRDKQTNGNPGEETDEEEDSRTTFYEEHNIYETAVSYTHLTLPTKRIV